MNALKYHNSRLGKTIEQIKQAYLSDRRICLLVCNEPELIEKIISCDSILPVRKATDNQEVTSTNIKIVEGDFIQKKLKNFEKINQPCIYVCDSISRSEESLRNYVNHITSLSRCNIKLSDGETKKLKNLKQSLILITVESKPEIETYIEPYSAIITVPLMNEDEFKEYVSEFLKDTEKIQTTINKDGYNIVANDHYLTKLYQNMMGLNATQIRTILKKNQIKLGNIYYVKNDVQYEDKLNILLKNIKHEFEQLIDTSRALSLEEASKDKPVGLDNIISWIEEIKEQVSNPEDFKKYLLESPKGLIVSGIPGSGKSMMAKYIAHILGLPLLRFDVGNIGGKYVGDSEKNMDKALELIDTLTPCVLWIDEIEKAFPPDEKSHETTDRAFGKLLTWIQERSKCFICATANDISKIKPELFRSGRFDGKFFTFMPTADECAEIFESIIKHQTETHDNNNKSKNLQAKPLFNLKKINGKLFIDLIESELCISKFKDDLNYREINKSNKFFTGADIAQLIKMAKSQYIYEYNEDDGDAVFDSNNFEICLRKAIQRLKTFGETDLESIAKCYAQLAINNFNSAASKFILPFEGYDYLDYKTNDKQDKVYLYNLNRVSENNEAEHYKKLTNNYDKCLFIIVRNTINKLAKDIVNNIKKI